MANWNRKDASTTDGLSPVRDLDWDYTGKLIRSEYDPWRGSPREYVWTDDAACAASDPELFQVSQLGDPEADHIPAKRTDLLATYNREKIKVAIGICEGCPVRATCLATASTSDLHWSVRGGQTPKRLAKQANIPSFPLKEYMPWTCVQCSGEKYGWHWNQGKQRKYCISCSA